MTISSTIRVAGPFTGTGVIAPYSFAGIKMFTVGDLLVTVTDLTGAEVVWDETTNYVTTLNPDQEVSPGGYITPVAALPTGYLLTITSDMDNLQPVILTNAGAFLPAVINGALDRLTILIQQLATKVTRALTFPTSDGVINTQLPTRALRASKTLGFDSNGDIIVGAVASAMVSTAMTPVVQALTIAAAKTLLGITTGTQNNYAAVAAPVVGNDSSQGYSVGSVWINTATNRSYVCFNAAIGAAVWVEDVLSNSAALVANANLATMAANTVKVNATAGAATPTDLALAASQLLGRGASGNVAPIVLGTGLSMSGTTLNAAVSGITLTATQATSSGNSKLFTGLPSTVKRVTMLFNQVSTNGTNPLIVTIGPSGGVVTSGYSGGSGYIYNASPASTARTPNGAYIYPSGASGLFSGRVVWELADVASNTWVASISGGLDDGANGAMVSGGASIALSGVLERIQVATANTFDFGSVTVTYE